MEKILIIEDEEDLCTLLAKKLAAADYQANWTTNPETTHDLIEKIRPSVILLDLKLGDYNGLAVLREIRQRDPRLPVIILTADNTLTTAVQAMSEGAFYYLVKPWDDRELKALLKKAIESRNLHRQIDELQQRVTEGETLLKDLVNAAANKLSKPDDPIRLTEVVRQATRFLEKRLILDALVKTHWHRGEASRLLGIDPKTLYNKIKEHDIPAA
ncbi:MAG: response regulator [Deltaproteobacteria bacterium]|nr:response regulator [Deltaproteobacteria bacterium]